MLNENDEVIKKLTKLTGKPPISMEYLMEQYHLTFIMDSKGINLLNHYYAKQKEFELAKKELLIHLG